jgi:hypothetical protein
MVKLHNKVEYSLLEKNHPLASKFSDSKWVLKVDYLAYIFSEVHNLNISMQGHNQTMVGLSEKVTTFKES